LLGIAKPDRAGSGLIVGILNTTDTASEGRDKMSIPKYQIDAWLAEKKREREEKEKASGGPSGARGFADGSSFVYSPTAAKATFSDHSSVSVVNGKVFVYIPRSPWK